MGKIKVSINVHYVPTNETVGIGIQWLDTEEEFDQLKDLLSESVRGNVAFLKLPGAGASAKDEIFIGQDLLRLSKITVKRCEQEPK